MSQQLPVRCLGVACLALLALGAAPPPPRAIAPAERVTLEAAGYVVPIALVSVSPRVKGVVVTLPIEEGKVVTKGEILARLDAAEYEADLAIARARVEVGLAKLERARTSGNPRDVTLARAELNVARATLAQAEWRVEATTVRAPISGTVVAKRTEVGNLVNPTSAGAGVSAIVCELADLRAVEVDLSIQERDLHRVSLGQPCVVYLDAYPKVEYRGRVSRLLPVADRARGAVPVRVRLEIPEKDSRIRLELRAVVSFLRRVEE